MINVMIVDDSAVVRETLKSIICEESDLSVIASAPDPVIASMKLESIHPDVIILDIEMPKMDGLSFLKKIMEENPIPVIICSSSVEKNSSNMMKAMEYGAVEFIQKPKLGTKKFLEESKINICDSIRAASISKTKIVSSVKNTQSSTVFESSFKAIKPKNTVPPKLSADAVLEKASQGLVIEKTEKVVVIGASTGGTEALKVLLEELPEDFPGTVVVQHMPEHFTKSFAERLDSLCRVKVVEAQNGEAVEKGKVLIAPGNKHTLLKRAGTKYYVEVKDGPLVSRHRPSVDVLFRSASRYAGQNAIGVIMTGMGDDGAKGMKEMHDMGSYNIAQDEKSCVVFGMPQEAIKNNAVDKVLPLTSIASELLSKVK